MLETQKILTNKYGLDFLKELGIGTTAHDDGRTIFNYSQIDSPKTHPVVRECRGLVLDSLNDYKLVAKGFNRFLNLGENQEDTDKFVWEGCTATEKEDGSLILLYHHNGNWFCNTRNSFSQGKINNQDITWAELVKIALWNVQRAKSGKVCPISSLPNLNELCDNFCKEYTYVLEICSLYNKIVKTYNYPQLFLLSCFDGEHEVPIHLLSYESYVTDVSVPKTLKFKDIDEVQKYIQEQAENDPTFEGVVLRDIYNHRLKVKSLKYILLHKARNNGFINTESMLQMIFDNEQAEFLSYFGNEFGQKFKELEEELQNVQKELLHLWNTHGTIKDRKEFALSVKHHPLSFLLFQARDNCDCPIELMKKQADKVAKYFE